MISAGPVHPFADPRTQHILRLSRSRAISRQTLLSHQPGSLATSSPCPRSAASSFTPLGAVFCITWGGDPPVDLPRGSWASLGVDGGRAGREGSSGAEGGERGVR